MYANTVEYTYTLYRNITEKLSQKNSHIAHPQRVFAVVITSVQVFVAYQPILLFHKNPL